MRVNHKIIKCGKANTFLCVVSCFEMNMKRIKERIRK